MRSIGHWGVLAVVFALLLSPMALMLESAPGEIERILQPRWTLIIDDDTGIVPENAGNGTSVIDLDVENDDGSTLWSITAGNVDTDSDGTGVFAIASPSGVITVNDDDDLNYEEWSSALLTVRANNGTGYDTETITITVTDVNEPPEADAGPDQVVDGGDTVFLDASSSSDPDAGASLVFTWAQTAGPTVTLSSSTSVQPTFTAPESTSTTNLVFSVTVTDGTNTDSDTVTITVTDVNDPTMTITSATVASGGSTNTAAVVLTYTSSEATTNFALADITVTDCTLSSFTTISSTVYGSTCTASSDGATPTVVVAADSFTDATGNANSVSNTYQWTYADDLEMSIAAAEIGSGGSSDDTRLSMHFTSSEPTSDFAASDITVTNGVISTFGAQSSTLFAAFLTPVSDGWVTVDIAAGTFTSSSTGESNTASTQFTWEYTPSGPTMTVSSGELSDGEVTASNSVNLTFTSSTATTDFTESDIYANHCAISDFTAMTADTYTATCTAPSDGSSSISVIGGVFSDEMGVANSPSNTFTWTYDGTGPSMTITSTEVSSGGTSGDPVIWLTFASNEPATDFTADDITVTNGVLSAFTPLVSTQYMAMLTPLTMGEVTVVEVGAWTYHDAVGNSNTGVQFLWTYLDLDSDNDGISDHYDPDDDNDGIMDIFDDLPLDPTDSIDTDGDGVGNTADEDDDGDGWTDDDEVLCGYDPVDSSSNPYDTDGDGTCDSIDADDDGDGVVDAEDAFPTLWSEAVDTDGDGNGDNADLDDDGDGVLDEDEVACISDPLDWDSLPVDTDGDGICDVLDGDADGDAVPDSNDAFPLDSTQWKDDDNDGLGDNPHGLNSDPYPGDRDNDGYPDVDDPFPLLATPGDKDNDGISDAKDVFPDDPEEWEDFDGDGVGDNADPDDDDDGWSDIDEEREGTNPYDAESEPITTFQLVLPGTWGGETIALDAWDLVGIFGGGPIILWLSFSFTTRNSRTAKVVRKMKSAKSREELNEIAEHTEYLLMLRLLGVHQGIKLERIRAELDDVLEARDGGDFAALDQTPEVEREAREEEWSKEPNIDDLESLADDLDDLYELTKE